MTTKEKEKQVVSVTNQLISLHSLAILSEVGNKLTIDEVKSIAKQCALVTVDEILEETKNSADKEIVVPRIIYFEKVKQEIERL
jgi:hypothetical protein